MGSPDWVDANCGIAIGLVDDLLNDSVVVKIKVRDCAGAVGE